MSLKRVLLIFILLLGYSGISQESEEKNYSISSKKIKFDPISNTFEYFGNVNFSSDIIQIVDANTISFNKRTGEIIAIGFTQFTADGEVHFKDHAKLDRLRYKLGESTVYLD